MTWRTNAVALALALFVSSEHSRAFNKRFSPIARFQHLIASPFN
jgi:hypothetical protein